MSTEAARPLELWLVRHGETTWNAEGRWQGQADAPLSERGREQARQLAHRLSGERFDAVYTSDLGRALETAEIVAAKLEGKPAVHPEPRLRETHVGEFSGLTQVEVKARGLWRPTFDYHDRYPGGESRAELTERLGLALASLAAAHPGGRVLAVSHGGAIRAALGFALGEPQAAVLAHFGGVENTAITRFALRTDGRGRLLAYNDAAHLEAGFAVREHRLEAEFLP